MMKRSKLVAVHKKVARLVAANAIGLTPRIQKHLDRIKELKREASSDQIEHQHANARRQIA